MIQKFQKGWDIELPTGKCFNFLDVEACSTSIYSLSVQL